MAIRDFATLVLLAAIWGASFLFIRIAAPVLGPLLLITLRVLIAGLALLFYAIVTRRLPSFGATWIAYLRLGVINAGLPFALIAVAVVQLNASMAAILNATTPLFAAIVAAVWINEALSFRKGLGLLLGLLGVVVLVGWSPVPLSWRVVFAVGASLLASLCYAIGGVYVKVAFGGISPLGLSIGQQLAAGLVLLPLGVATAPPTWPSSTVVFAVLALALLSTAIGYMIYFVLMERIGPTKTLSVTFLVPLFGVLWGALFLNEPVKNGTLAGLALILTSVVLVSERRVGLNNIQAKALSRR